MLTHGFSIYFNILWTKKKGVFTQEWVQMPSRKIVSICMWQSVSVTRGFSICKWVCSCTENYHVIMMISEKLPLCKVHCQFPHPNKASLKRSEEKGSAKRNFLAFCLPRRSNIGTLVVVDTKLVIFFSYINFLQQKKLRPATRCCDVTVRPSDVFEQPCVKAKWWTIYNKKIQENDDTMSFLSLKYRCHDLCMYVTLL